MLQWFQKAQKQVDDAENASAIKQGNYTDHVDSPYSMRHRLDPMGYDEMDAFDWVINLMDKEHPDARGRQSDLMDYAIDRGWFYVDPQGMLRVAEKAP